VCAFVTGASRGLGKFVAVELAKCGFDVAIASRTVNAGEAHVHDGKGARALKGSLCETAREIERLGKRAFVVKMDLLDIQGCLDAIDQVLAHFDRIDCFVNASVYKGPGNQQSFRNLQQRFLEDILKANVVCPVMMARKILEQMRNQDGPCSIFLFSSSSINMEPKFPLEKGGWDFAYVASKAAISKLAGIVSVEEVQNMTDLRIFNIEPGLVVTELMKESGENQIFTEKFGSESPETSAKVISFLAKAKKDSLIQKFNGRSVFAPSFLSQL